MHFAAEHWQQCRFFFIEIGDVKDFSSPSFLHVFPRVVFFVNSIEVLHQLAVCANLMVIIGSQNIRGGFGGI